jgi:hypothetical protein
MYESYGPMSKFFPSGPGNDDLGADSDQEYAVEEEVRKQNRDENNFNENNNEGGNQDVDGENDNQDVEDFFIDSQRRPLIRPQRSPLYYPRAPPATDRTNRANVSQSCDGEPEQDDALEKTGHEMDFHAEETLDEVVERHSNDSDDEGAVTTAPNNAVVSHVPTHRRKQKKRKPQRKPRSSSSEEGEDNGS